MISAKTQDRLPDLKGPKLSLSGLQFGAIATLVTAGGSILVGLWLGLMLLLDPNSILWLNRFLPNWGQVPLALSNPLQTLEEIERELADQQLSLGAELVLENEVILPVWQTVPNCTTEQCEAITALRVYYAEGDTNSSSRRYSLLNELPVGARAFDNFAELKRLPRLGDRTEWLSLEGSNAGSELTSGSRYGLILRYDPYGKELQALLPWESQAGRSPQWSQVIEDKPLELVVDQSKNLEPKFDVFIVENNRQSPVFEALTVDKSAIALPVYQNALELARLNLWAIAARELEDVKATLKPAQWNDEAEKQKQFVAYHGQEMTDRCDSTTLNAVQTIGHCLRAGDVNEALRLLENNLDDPLVMTTVVSFLEKNGRDIQTRLDALHGLDPLRESVAIWQFLTLTAEKGPQGAIATLQEQQQLDKELDERIQTLLGHVETTLSQQTRTLSADSKIIGKIRRARRINPSAWLQPESETIALSPNENWHILEVERFFDGRQWQQAPFDLELSNFVPGQSLWQSIGLKNNGEIYISDPDLSMPTNNAFGAVKAAQLVDGNLQLLVDAPQKLSGEQLAYSHQTLRWLAPSFMSLQELSQIEPVWVDEILTNLWQHLRASDLRTEKSLPELETLLEEFGAWQVQPLELTGNNHSDVRLTLYLDTDGAITSPSLIASENTGLISYELIFGDTGALLYSEVNQTSSNRRKLTAIADLQDGGVAALLFSDQNDKWTFERWNPVKQAFEVVLKL